MAHSRGHRDRPKRERKKPKETKDRTESGKQVFRSHPIYGKIPMIQASITINGSTHRYETYDLDFQPDLPVGALRGDVRRQHFCPMCHAPKYFYLDQKRECVQCGEGFVFSADEQKYWYETLKFHFDSVAIRCPRCRRLRRSERALHAQMSAARQGLREKPDDPALLLADAEACVRYRQRTGEGDLDRAIASARKAANIWPDGIEAHFWEGLAQNLASRPARAKTSLQTFMQRSAGRKRYRKYVKEARGVIEELDGAEH